MKIGIDIDGVILNFEKTMNYYAEYYDYLIGNQNKKQHNFNYLQNYNWTKEQKETFIKEYLIKGTKECSLIPGSKEIIDLLHTKGLEIILITARGSINKNTKKEVLNTLKKYQIYYDSIYFEVKDKSKKCHELEIDIMIDDNPQICSNLIENKIKTIYFKDNDIKLRNNKYLKTLSNWAEILRYLIKINFIK